MSQRNLRVVKPAPETVHAPRLPAPPAGRFVTFEEFEAVRRLLVDALGDYEDTCAAADPLERIVLGNRKIRAALGRL